MHIPTKALQLVAAAYTAGWDVSMTVQAKFETVTVTVDDLGHVSSRRTLSARWVDGVWASGYMFTGEATIPRKIRNAGEIRRIMNEGAK
jgi:hypothetical protein